MNSELIECPACKHALRVPENLFGKTVRCPECKSHFTAPVRDAEGKLGVPVRLPQQVNRPVTSTAARFSSSPLFVPAMLLILVSTIGSLVNGYQAVIWHVDRVRAERATTWLIEQYASVTKQDIPQDQLQALFDAGMVVHHVFFACSLLSLSGGIAMLVGRYRRLAILGSVIAMINISNGCCLVGFPTGGYCLIKLIDPDLAPLFQRAK